MKVLALCAGYGTRLQRGVDMDATGRFNHLSGVPKPLVPLGGRPLLSYWLDALANVPGIDITEDFYLVTNTKFKDQFIDWADNNGIDASHVISNWSTSNEDRLGAIRDMQMAVEEVDIDDDLLVLGGDTLFYDDFDMEKLLDEFNQDQDYNFVCWYRDEMTNRTGIIETDEHGIVTAFLEKPDPSETVSRKACPCFYVFRRSTLALLRQYVKSAKSLKEVDAPGNFVAWLHSRSPIFATEISGRFDIGALDSYIEANDHFTRKNSKT